MGRFFATFSNAVIFCCGCHLTTQQPFVGHSALSLKQREKSDIKSKKEGNIDKGECEESE